MNRFPKVGETVKVARLAKNVNGRIGEVTHRNGEYIYVHLIGEPSFTVECYTCELEEVNS